MDSVRESAVSPMMEPISRQVEESDMAEQLGEFVPGSPEEKRLVHKIDLYLMPILWIKYVFNYIDRTNIVSSAPAHNPKLDLNSTLTHPRAFKGNAKIAGMQHDLSLTDDGYAWVLSVFFFGYLLCEVPSNMLLSRSRPSVFLPTTMLVWGALSACMAASRSYAALLVFRFVLGCVESGFFPGVLYVLSCWYTKAELGKRFAVFYTAAVSSGAVGGILAGAITANLHGACGIAGWRWLFIIEGVATVTVALASYFILLDYPSTSKKLSPEEQRLATLRIVHDGIANGSVGKPRLSHWQAFVATVSDPRTYIFIMLYMLDIGAGTISYFIPTITLTLGYGTVEAQYMTVPIYAVAAVCLNIIAWSSDRHIERCWHISGALAIGFIGSVVCAAVQHAVVRYVMICFIAAGIWSAVPLILTWTSDVISLPPEKRAIVLALVNAFGNFSSVYGSRIWPKDDSPGYQIGFGVTAAFLGAAMVLAMSGPLLCRLSQACVCTNDADPTRLDNTKVK